MTSSRRARMSGILSFSGLALLASTCHQEPPRFEGLDPRKMPEAIRPNYALFAQRCSKCHSLARPLQSGITGDDFWAAYVERMRLQPGSGISLEDAALILRFLHYFSTGQVPTEASSPSLDGGDE